MRCDCIVLVFAMLLMSCCFQEELLGIIREYEKRGYFDEIMALLEAGLSLERAHVSLFFNHWALAKHYPDGCFHGTCCYIQQVPT